MSDSESSQRKRIKLSDPAQLRQFYDTQQVRQSKRFREAALESESMSTDEQEERSRQNLMQVLRDDRRARFLAAECGSDDPSQDALAEDAQLAKRFALCERDRLCSAHLGQDIVYDDALQQMVNGLREQHAQLSSDEAHEYAAQALNSALAEYRSAEVDRICVAKTTLTYDAAKTAICQQLAAASVAAGGSGGSADENEREARKQLDALVDAELRDARLRSRHTSAIMKLRTDGECERRARSSEDLAAMFKRYVGVQPGAALLELEQEIRSTHPKLSEQQVVQRAKLQLGKMKKNFKLAWQTNVSDARMMELLRKDASPEALSIIVRYQQRLARLESRTPSEAAVRASDIALNETSREMYERRRRKYRDEARDLLANTGPGGDGDDDDDEDDTGDTEKAASVVLDGTDASLLTPVDNLRKSPLEVAKRVASLNGAITNLNHYSEPIEPGVYDMADYAAKYTTNKSRSEEMHRGDLMEQLLRDEVDSLNLHVKMISIAPPGAVLTRSGAKTTGNAVEDLRELLCASDVEHDYLHETLVAYQLHWQRNYQESTLDISKALTTKFHAYDRERVARLAHGLGLSHDRVAANDAYGQSPENNAILSAVMRAAASDLFRRTQRQAAAETKLDERVRKEQKRASGKKRKTAPADPASAPSLSTSKTIASLIDTPLDKCSDPRLVLALPEVSRIYLQSHMRQPCGEEYGERQCVLDNNCVCLVLAAEFPEVCKSQRKGAGFIAMEFLLPDEKRAWNMHRILPAHRKMCVLCDRVAVTWRYMEAIASGVEPELPLHEYRVAVDREGEYRLDSCLPFEVGAGKLTGVVAPFVGFNLCDYVYGEVEAGNRRLLAVLETSNLDFRLCSDPDLII